MVMSHRREASLRNYIVRFFKWTKNLLCYSFSALTGRPHQSLQPSVTVLSPRAIFMFLWIRLAFIHKTNALNKSKMCWIRPAELFQIVYFSSLWTLMRWNFWQLWFFSTYQIIWTILANFLIGLFTRVLGEYKICWQHFCSLWKLYVLKTERNARGIWRIIYYKTNKESLQKVGRNIRLRLVFPPTLLSCSSLFPSTLQHNRTKHSQRLFICYSVKMAGY